MYSIISQFVAQTNHTNNYYLENGYGIMYMYIFLLHSFLFSDKNHRNKCVCIYIYIPFLSHFSEEHFIKIMFDQNLERF